MCGIAGIVNFDGAPVQPAQVEAMIATLVHRGPDGAGVWVDGPVGFGHRRLAIRDLSEGGRQPMHGPDGSVTVTYNGEIYNEAGIRRDLRMQAGVQFHTTCDAEIIAPAWRQWGVEAFKRFEGIYAIAIWDAANRRLVLARDPVGIKPLYFSWVGRSLRFASEVKALLAPPDQPRTLDPDSVHRFLAQGYPGPDRTMLAGVTPVPPGSALIVDADGARVEQFWRVARDPVITDLDEARDAFLPLWREVVHDQLISDVPLGLLLSGGIDSALVATALSARDNVPAFTARFGDASYDETELASIAARHAGLEHRLVTIDDTHDLEERFRRVVHHVDGALADSSALGFYSLCREARKHVPVLLTGDGADDHFAGYETYRASRIAAWGRHVLPRPLARRASRALFAIAGRSEGRVTPAEKAARLLAGVSEGARAHAQWRRYLYPDTAAALYGPAMIAAGERSIDALADYAAMVDGAEGNVVDRTLIADTNYFLPGDLLVKSDTMSMAHGVEVRVPFLDRRIMEFAGSLHSRLLSPIEGPDKRVLRSALSSLGLPRALTHGRKKGFNVPAAAYLRTGLRPLGERLLDRDADVLSPLLRPDAVRRLWRGHIEGRGENGYALWALLTLAEWRTSAGV